MQNNTLDSILEALQKMSESKEPIDAHIWLNGCSKMLALIGDEQNKLFDLENKVTNFKMIAMSTGDSVSKAKIVAESTPEYLEARKLKAKIERVFEIIRVAKLMARMSQDELKSY